MHYVSTDVRACQEIYNDSQQTRPGFRCTFCWALKTTYTVDGRFVSYRVFCHHAGCPEWEKVSRRMAIAPILFWNEHYSGIFTKGAFSEFKDTVDIHTDWVGFPLADGRTLVYAERDVIGLNRVDNVVAEELERIMSDMPIGKRVKRPLADRGDEVRQRPIIVRPKLDYRLPGVSVERLEFACRKAGIETIRTGYYKDCVESLEPLTFEQSIVLSDLLWELQG